MKECAKCIMCKLDIGNDILNSVCITLRVISSSKPSMFTLLKCQHM